VSGGQALVGIDAGAVAQHVALAHPARQVRWPLGVCEDESGVSRSWSWDAGRVAADGAERARRRGMQRRVTDPAGQQYLLQAAPSGYVSWSVYTVQGPVEYLWWKLGMAVAKVGFRGGWTLTVWRGDAIAPKRTRVRKVRYPDAPQAIAAFEEAAAEIARAGLRPTA
jgi:hypothetical protein